MRMAPAASIAACLGIFALSACGSGVDFGGLTANYKYYVYVSHANASSSISVLTMDPDSGALTETSQHTETLAAPWGLGLHPSGNFLYAANTSTTSLSAFKVTPETGALTSVSSRAASGALRSTVAITNDGRFAYAASASGIAGFPLDQKSGAPTSYTMHDTSVGIIWAAVLSPDGKHIVAGTSGNGLRVYQIDFTGGGLSNVAQSGAFNNPVHLAAHPTRNIVYVVDNVLNSIIPCGLTDAGGLSLYAPLALATSPRSIAVDPKGDYVVVVTDSAMLFKIQADGTLADKGFYAVGANPNSVAIDPTGNFVYVTNFDSDNVSAFRIDRTNQSLIEMPGFTFPNNSGPQGVLTARIRY